MKVFLLQAATGVYDSLLRDIERAQAELSAINTALTNTGIYQVCTPFTTEDTEMQVLESVLIMRTMIRATQSFAGN